MIGISVGGGTSTPQMRVPLPYGVPTPVLQLVELNISAGGFPALPAHAFRSPPPCQVAGVSAF